MRGKTDRRVGEGRVGKGRGTRIEAKLHVTFWIEVPLG